MKRLICILAVLSGAFCVNAQTDSLPIPPFKRFPSVPPFKLLSPDSVTFHTKQDLPRKKATMLMLFSPDCDHCKHETEEIIREIDKFRNVEIVMATMLPFEKMKEFYIQYDLGRFRNIMVGRDVNFMLPGFYNVRSLPFLAFYDKKGNLIDTFEGALPIEKILEKLKD